MDDVVNENESSADLNLLSSTEVDKAMSNDPVIENESTVHPSEREDLILTSAEEAGLTSMEGNEDEETGKEDKVDPGDLIKTLGYRPLTLQIFHKMRETFGHEECEYCGKLYYNKMDYEQHIRTHTGNDKHHIEVKCLLKQDLQAVSLRYDEFINNNLIGT